MFEHIHEIRRVLFDSVMVLVYCPGMNTLRKCLFRFMLKTGITHLKQRHFPRRTLTIPGYHQICIPTFLRETMGWNMTPEIFQMQIEYIAGHCNVLSGQQLEEYICRKTPVPKNAVAITFDDGYRDVYDIALPILKKFGIPAIVFITTGAVDNKCSLWTNVIYYHFYLTKKTQYHLVLPDGSSIRGKWCSPLEKSHHARFVIRKLKSIPNDDRKKAVSVLATALESGSTEDPFDHLPMLNWDMIRSLASSGLFSLGAHTVSHPVLSQCTIEEQQMEMRVSKTRIEEESGQPCRYFAYPNGQPEDYTDRTCLLAREIGFSLAFTFWPGKPGALLRSMEVPRHPILTDDLAEFAWQLR